MSTAWSHHFRPFGHDSQAGSPRERPQPVGAPDQSVVRPCRSAPVDEVSALRGLKAVIEETAPHLTATLCRPVATPVFLRVSNPICGGQLAEDITVQIGEPAVFWWSWQEPICPVTAPGIAAAAVVKVLSGPMNGDGR